MGPCEVNVGTSERDDCLDTSDIVLHSSCNEYDIGQRQDIIIERIAASFLAIEKNMGCETVAAIIENIEDPMFSVERFKGTIKSTLQRMQKSETMEGLLERNGFQQKIVKDDEKGFNGTLYYRDVKQVLSDQLSLAHENNTYYFPKVSKSPDGVVQYKHPMDTEKAVTMYHEIRAAVMSDSRSDVFWRETAEEEVPCFVGFVQVYSDKTHTTMKTSGVVAYPIHITLQNFSEPVRRACIDSGLSLMGYLPVSVEEMSNDNSHSRVTGTSGAFIRPLRMKILHECIRFLLQPLENVHKSGFIVTDGRGKKMCCHPTISSYIADIPEAKDACGVKHGTKVRCPCHRCYVPSENLNGVERFPNRSRSDTLERREKYKQCMKEAEVGRRKHHVARTREAVENANIVLGEVSLSEYSSCLEQCALFDTQARENMYSVFAFEPLHNFHLGISKLLKTCIMSRLNSNNMTSTAGSKTGQPRTFRALRHVILRGANDILAGMQRDCNVRGFQVDFSSGEKGSGLNGMFRNDGLRGMLEAKDYRAVDMVFPFIAAFIDRCCDEVSDAPITTICTSYGDITNQALRHGSEEPWTKKEIDELEKRIDMFKVKCRETLGPFHPSELRTLKFHLLDHLCDDIRTSGGMQYVHAGPYEASHTMFKEHYRKTSCRKSTAMEETMNRMDTESALRKAQKFLSRHEGRDAYVRRRHELQSQRMPKMVRDGFSINITSFQNTLRDSAELLSQIEGQPSRNRVQPLYEKYGEKYTSLLCQLGDQAGAVFIRLVHEKVNSISPSSSSRNVTVTVVKSAFVYGGFTPTSHHCDDSHNKIWYERGHPIYYQRIIATSCFGPAKKPRYSFVLLSGDDGGDGNKDSLWIAKVLVLLRVSEVASQKSSELAFVQYMEYTPPKDNIDNVLGCVTLRWSTTDERDHTLSEEKRGMEGNEMAPWYGLVPITSVKGTIHVIRIDYHTKPFTPDIPWWKRRFYLNRFYTDHTAVDESFIIEGKDIDDSESE